MSRVPAQSYLLLQQITLRHLLMITSQSIRYQGEGIGCWYAGEGLRYIGVYELIFDAFEGRGKVDGQLLVGFGRACLQLYRYVVKTRDRGREDFRINLVFGRVPRVDVVAAV